MKTTRNAEFDPSELQFVGGLLKWIGDDSRSPYMTRSVLAVRAPVGEIGAWDGSATLPEFINPKSMLLVTAGSASTDPLMLDPHEICPNPLKFVHHYKLRTIRALFLTTLSHQ
jgi:hypothetical protein